jgi:hypothetical protein
MDDTRATDALTATLNRIAEGYGWRAVWGETGGGCTAIVISRQGDDRGSNVEGCDNYPDAVLMMTDSGSQAPLVHGDFMLSMGEVRHEHGPHGCGRESYHDAEDTYASADALTTAAIEWTRDRLASLTGAGRCDKHPDRPAVATDDNLNRMCDECYRALDI